MPLFNKLDWNRPLDDQQLNLISSGQGVFETLLFEDNIVWFWERHARRFAGTLELFGIEFQAKYLGNIITEALAALDGNHTMRIKLMALFPFDQPPQTLQNKDLVLLIEPVGQQIRKPHPVALKTIAAPLAPGNHLTGRKTLAYTYFNFGRRLARDGGFDEALFITTEQKLQETSYSNIFAIQNEQIVTPPLSSGLLPGTVRSLLIDFCGVSEKEIGLNDLAGYDFFFLSSSLRELHAVQKINHLQFKTAHPVFDALSIKWQEIRSAYQAGTLK